MAVTPRSLALVLATACVFGLGLYLFVEVRAAPAPIAVQGPSPDRKAPIAREDAPPHEEVPPTTPKPATPKAPTRDEREPVHLGTTDVAADDPKANPKLDSVMDEANRAYDHQEFDDARALAAKVLQKQPGNIRMLRVMVSSSCVDGDKETAQKYFDQLPKFDRDQMKQRCDRFGIAFKDPAQ
ncbi:MAG: hypothetical protein JWO36_2879 [Myxococcales bacterium]|nr:hypothetical protein [Myxococcales bacterium]